MMSTFPGSFYYRTTEAGEGGWRCAGDDGKLGEVNGRVKRVSDPYLPNSVIRVALGFLTRRGGTLSYPEAHRGGFLTCSLRAQVAKYKISMLRS